MSEALILTLLLQTAPTTNPLFGFLPMILIFGIFYFLLFMPMQRQKKQQREMLASLQSGQVVHTTGGIVGTIVSLNAEDDTLILRVKPDNVKIQMARNAVAGLLSEK
jgi:preprotein translocase subunit YajC